MTYSNDIRLILLRVQMWKKTLENICLFEYLIFAIL